MQNYPISVLTEGLRLSKTGVLRRKNLQQKTQKQQKTKQNYNKKLNCIVWGINDCIKMSPGNIAL